MVCMRSVALFLTFVAGVRGKGVCASRHWWKERQDVHRLRAMRLAAHLPPPLPLAPCPPPATAGNDIHRDCANWAAKGQCQGKNKDYMISHCPISCGICKFECKDTEESCPSWAREGECTTNLQSMLSLCPTSCGICSPVCAFPWRCARKDFAPLISGSFACLLGFTAYRCARISAPIAKTGTAPTRATTSASATRNSCSATARYRACAVLAGTGLVSWPSFPRR